MSMYYMGDNFKMIKTWTFTLLDSDSRGEICKKKSNTVQI